MFLRHRCEVEPEVNITFRSSSGGRDQVLVPRRLLRRAGLAQDRLPDRQRRGQHQDRRMPRSRQRVSDFRLLLFSLTTMQGLHERLPLPTKPVLEPVPVTDA